MKLDDALKVSEVEHALDEKKGSRERAARLPLGEKESVVTFNGLKFYINHTQLQNPGWFYLYEFDAEDAVVVGDLTKYAGYIIDSDKWEPI